MRVSFEGEVATIVIPLRACGWGYANAGCKLHKTASRCGVPRVCDFFTPKDHTGALPWFPVSAGLENIAGLVAELAERPKSVCDSGYSLPDLTELERTLRAAPASRFRLSILTHAEQDAASDTIADPTEVSG